MRALPDGIGLSEDQLGFVGVGYEDIRLREHDLETVEVRTGAGRRHVEQGERTRRLCPPEPIGQLVGVEIGEDQEIADVQDRARIGARRPGRRPRIPCRRPRCG